ncbi:MAG TPA: hypothetical protein VIK38_06215 [Coriobacteriia bacterium]
MTPLRRASVAQDSPWSRSESGRTAATDEDALLRLALWLAEVAAEAAVAATAPAASSTPGAAAPGRGGVAKRPPTTESAL